MNLSNFKLGVTRFIGSAKLALNQHAPTILMIGGLVGIGVSTVLACKATLKVNDILTEHNNKVEQIRETADDPDIPDYSEEDATSDVQKLYAKTSVNIVREYGPAIVVGAISVFGIVKGQHILHKRNLALAAGYATLDGLFKDYRKRVVDRFGEDVDKQLRYNLVDKTLEPGAVDPDTGEVLNDTSEPKTITDIVEGQPSGYAKFFDESCPGWEKNAEMNRIYLEAEERLANNILWNRGYLFLNEVYKRLGILETVAGQHVGWVYDPDNPTGDNKVSFGIFDVNRKGNREFVNGYERSILLDFNVDGDITSILSKRHKMAAI